MKNCKHKVFYFFFVENVLADSGLECISWGLEFLKSKQTIKVNPK